MDDVTIESLKQTRRSLAERSDRKGVADCDVKIAQLEAAEEAAKAKKTVPEKEIKVTPKKKKKDKK